MPPPSFRLVNCLRTCLHVCLAPRHRLRLALVVSLCAHLLILFPPHWNWWYSPRHLPEIARLNVMLKQAQSAQTIQPEQAPAPPTLPQTAPISTPAPAPEKAPRPALPVEAPPAAEAMETPVSAKKDGFTLEIPEFSMPREGYGAMRYIVYYGEQRLEAGYSELSWIFSNGRYYLNLNTKSADEVLPNPGAARASSKGNITPEGMQPESHSLKSANRAEDVEFIWELQRITGLQQDMQLHPDSQDILSLQFQLAAAIASGRPLEFWLITDWRYELFQFTILDESPLELPAGILRTLHLQSVGNGKTLDFWLAEDHQMLPVKTRFTGENGDIYEQVAIEIPIRNDETVIPEPALLQ